jgi:hypothetical protein
MTESKLEAWAKSKNLGPDVIVGAMHILTVAVEWVATHLGEGQTPFELLTFLEDYCQAELYIKIGDEE